MKINKVTIGFVTQVYDTETGKCDSQEFIAGDEVSYEDQYGENFDIDDSETELEYQPYEMIQPWLS